MGEHGERGFLPSRGLVLVVSRCLNQSGVEFPGNINCHTVQSDYIPLLSLPILFDKNRY